MPLVTKHSIRDERLHWRLACERNVRASGRNLQHRVTVVVVDVVELFRGVEGLLAFLGQDRLDGGVFPTRRVLDDVVAWE